MCSCSPESQPYPVMHMKNHGQQIKGSDSPHLLCSGETPSGVLRPALESPVQERHWPDRVGPEEDHENDERTGMPLL